MSKPKWLVIARNQYLLSTSAIRGIRPYFPYLVIGLLAVYVTYLVPSLVSLFIDDAIAILLSQVAVALMQILLFNIFIFFIVIPITLALREVQAGHLELLLAAPVKPSDVLLGEFVGTIPIWAIGVTAIAGLFTAILSPIGLDFLQMAIIITIIVITFLSAYWIGHLIAALLRTKLGKTARGRDIGTALSVIIALPLVAFMYAMIGGDLLEILADPGTSGMISSILGLLPSSWGAEVIVGFASNPSNIAAVGFETLTRFGGLLVFFIATLWLGGTAANRAYNLEPTSFVASVAKPDGIFYGIVNYLAGGGSFGILVVSIFKDYGRRLENLSRVFYIVGVAFVLNIFISNVEDPEDILVYSPIIFAMIAAFVAGEITVRGKAGLFIYKTAPSGVWRFIRARLLQSWMIVVPVAAAISALQIILFLETSLISLLSVTGVVTLNAAASVAFVIGVFLLNPAFSTKSGNYMPNMMIILFVSIGLFLVSMVVLDNLWWIMPLNWLVGIIFLYLGKRKFDRIE